MAVHYQCSKVDGEWHGTNGKKVKAERDAKEKAVAEKAAAAIKAAKEKAAIIKKGRS